MNTQNLINLTLTQTQIANVDAALTTLENELAGLIALSGSAKRHMRKMGTKSESFSRQALHVVSQNPTMIPANIPVADAIADLQMLDQLRPRLSRLTRLTERANDTDAALGNDIMTVALQAYGLLKLTGGAAGMESQRRELSGVFSRTKRSPKRVSDSPPEQKAA